MGEEAPLELRPGCIHQAWDQAFTCLAHVWPSTTRGPDSNRTDKALHQGDDGATLDCLRQCSPLG
jgi:hypothetical protein